MTAASKSVARDGSPPQVILVVDDDVLIRLAIAEYLRDCGFHVFEAADGVEAVTILTAAELAVDLVFSDVQMPGMDGVALAQWVQAHRPNTRVLLTTGDAAAVAQRANELCHIGPVVPKPYDHALLVQRIKRMIERAERGS
jgi:CheY-like chemotaxis protein